LIFFTENIERLADDKVKVNLTRCLWSLNKLNLLNIELFDKVIEVLDQDFENRVVPMTKLDLQSFLESMSDVYQERNYKTGFMTKITGLILDYLRSFDRQETVPTKLVMSLIKSYKAIRYSQQEIFDTLHKIVIKKLDHPGSYDEKLVFFAFNRLVLCAFSPVKLMKEIVKR